MRSPESAKLPAGRGHPLVFALLAAGMVTMAFGLLALLGWVSGWLRLASFGANLMPMAPSTAVLLLLYGVAICLRARTPLSRRAYWFSVGLVGLGSLVAFLLFTLGCLHIQWEGEHFGLNLPGTIGGAAIGHISPVSAFCFLLASVSFLASLSQSALRSWRAVLALSSAGLLLGTGFIFMLAYFYGTPLLYGREFIPPALNTILAFVTLGLALLALAGRAAGLFHGLPGVNSRPVVIFTLIFFLLAIGIVTVGYISYRNYETRYRVQMERQLSAIQELKVGELVRWRQERFADAAVFFKNPAFSALVRRFFDQPADADAQRQLLDWLGKYPENYHYNQIRLVDDRAISRMTIPVGRPPASSFISERIREVQRSGQIMFQDLYRSAQDQRVYMAVIVPILDESEGNRSLGALIFRIDPQIYLYPFIERWPTPSQTAETILVRREGNDALFLNDLKFKTNAPLNLRVSLRNTRFSVASAVLGKSGIVEGRDYCGCLSIAAVGAVPDSPWFLVARMDAEEVYAPLRGRYWEMVVTIGVLLLGAGGGMGLVWWHQRVRFYRDQAESAESLRESELRFRILFDLANDGIMVLDSDGRLISVNQSFAQMHGYCVAEMSGMTLKDLDAPDSMQRKPERMARLLAGESLTFDVEHYHKDGHIFPLEVSASLMSIGKQSLIQCIHRDITERKQAEAVQSQSRKAALNMMRDAIEARDQAEQMSRALHQSGAEIRELNLSLEQRVLNRTAELRAANQELDAFAYTVSHDLRQPLRAMSGFSQALVEDCGKTLPGEAQKHLDEIILASWQMGELIDGLLRLARSTRGELNYKNVDISALAVRLLSELEAVEPNRRVAWAVEPGLTAWGDERLIEAMLANLLSNAWKYTAKTPQPKIEVGMMKHRSNEVMDKGQNSGAGPTQHSTVFFVRDNGAGFDMKHAAKLFQPFQRLHREDEFPGIGIGLATVQRIVHRHGGTIRATSAPGQGATFCFNLSSLGGRSELEA